MPGTKPCHTPASYSSRSNRRCEPSSSNRQSSTPSATSEATATFVPPSVSVAPSGKGRPGRAASFGTCPTQAPPGVNDAQSSHPLFFPRSCKPRGSSKPRGLLDPRGLHDRGEKGRQGNMGSGLGGWL